MLEADKGWISRRGADGVYRRVCWLPHERRDHGVIACWGERVCVGAASGMVTILDFSSFMTEHKSAFVSQLAL
jgi:hypothetical protein